MKSSKDKKANGPDSGKGLVFKITSKVPYKTVLKGVFPILLVRAVPAILMNFF